MLIQRQFQAGPGSHKSVICRAAIMAKISVVIFIVFALTLPAVLTYKIEKSIHPDHPHECYDQEVDTFYQHGSYNQRPGKCEMIRCFADSSMESVGCHTKTLQPGCTASDTDFKKSYPDCCPRITCTPPPSNNGHDHHNGNHHNYHTNSHSNYNHNYNNQKVIKMSQNSNNSQTSTNSGTNGAIGVKG